MKTTPKQLIILLSILTGMMTMTTNCTKETDKDLVLPVVSTLTTITNITGNAASCGGIVTDDKGQTVTARGVCWSTSNPSIKDSLSADGNGVGSYTSKLQNLLPNTTYFVRAYATNSNGTTYGDAMSFRTLTLPTMHTGLATNVKATAATLGIEVVDNGGLSSYQCGICYSTSGTPTVANTKVYASETMGIFSVVLTNLTPQTTYWARAFSTSSEGVSYGLPFSFTTLATYLPVLTTNDMTNIVSTTATTGSTISDDGGAAITDRGVCCSTAHNPTIDLATRTSNGSGVGSYTININGLTALTTYYVRAYATSSMGTSYGNEVTFTTKEAGSTFISSALIPAGTFTMGSPTTEVNRSTDETQYQVTLSAFRMSKYEITNTQYAAFLNAKGIGKEGLYAAGAYPTQLLLGFVSGSFNIGLHYSGTQWTTIAGYENMPVINVTWYGAAEFATYAGGTLPTEAQWEYACRAGTTSPFSTGDFLTNLQANYDWAYPYNGSTNTVPTGIGNIQPVGSYAPNAFSLYDMHGNVYEWCNDWYDTYPSSAKTNPMGATSGSARVLRGGSFGNYAQQCRSAWRGNTDPGTANSYIGFRVVFLP